MIKRRFRKVKRVKELIPDSIAEKALTLNPLTPPDQPAAPEQVPRITNENITEHREDVLKGARKYIYPLQHSKHRIVTVTLSLAAVTAVAFLIYCSMALYHFYQYNTFLYRVTQVVPFPVAKADGNYVSYENYLFELRHYIHYYQSQQQLNFNSSDKQQLYRFRQQALGTVLDQTYTKIIARQNGVSVSGKEVDARIAEVRNQNRLGTNTKVFADVLRDYWGWSISDFKRTLKQEILSEKVAAKLDKAANQRAQAALVQIKGGADFAEVAKATSDDPAAKASGGDFGLGITKTNPNVSPEIIDAMFKLKAGETSGIILASPVISGAPPSLQIVKVTQNDGKSVSGQHIVFNLKPTQVYINELKAKNPPHLYVKF
jgi:hypothetical protein